MKAELERAGAVVPDAVTGPQPWPNADECTCDTCPVCVAGDDDWDARERWRDLYAELYAAHDKLIGQVRTTADELVTGGYSGAVGREAGRYLRARVGDAQVRRMTLPPPRR